jgi:hypothetical protein
MVTRWVQHVGNKVIRGEGTPPASGDYSLISDVPEETVTVVNGELRVGGKKVTSHTVTLKSGEVITFSLDNKGQLKRSSKKPGKK